ncbi:DUF2264 domain-containing protein [Vibrio fluvialis]|uniref:DUF2264 domain-containing protein n=1 Tax=Vibrio fluvialis TaxID=676 RepID=UPI0028F6D8A6|nr:DUF2264 domain-containing protein [Vibrio fluvialis]
MLLKKIVKANQLCKYSIERFIYTKRRKYWLNIDEYNDATFLKDISKFFIDVNIEISVGNGSHTYYRGYPSSKNARIDAFEGSSRILPLIATFVTYIEPDEIYVRHIRRAILEGTNIKSDWYWGYIEDFDQKLCEMHDIALCLYISRDFVFDKYSYDEKKIIQNWLESSLRAKVKENNWILFKLLIQAVLDELYGMKTFDYDLLNNFHSLHEKNGLFVDGKQGDVDHYNSWAIHYTLFFIYKIKKIDWIKNVLISGGSSYEKILNRKKVPLYGRSLCYRYAIPTSCIVKSILTKSKVNETIELTISYWRLFGKNDRFESGLPRQIHSNEDRYDIEPYIGPASSLWSLRSLVVGLMLYKSRDEFDTESALLESTGDETTSDGIIMIPKKLVVDKKKLVFIGDKGGSIKPKLITRVINKLNEVCLGRNILKAKSIEGKVAIEYNEF